MSKFDPEVYLDARDRGFLVQLTHMEGYKVLHRLMRAEVDKFIVQQINADPAEPAKVLAAHNLAKAAAQFYQGLTDAINEEIAQYVGTKDDQTPVDVTKGLIDLGESAFDVSDQLYEEENGSSN